jgi:hypothetical protein
MKDENLDELRNFLRRLKDNLSFLLIIATFLRISSSPLRRQEGAVDCAPILFVSLRRGKMGEAIAAMCKQRFIPSIRVKRDIGRIA